MESDHSNEPAPESLVAPSPSISDKSAATTVSQICDGDDNHQVSEICDGNRVDINHQMSETCHGQVVDSDNQMPELYDNQGVITVTDLKALEEELLPPSPSPPPKEKRMWLCEQLGRLKYRRHNNILNMTEEELESIRNQTELNEMKHEAKFREMYSSYITGVIGDEGIMKDMNELVSRYDHMNAKKRWNLHERFQKDVYKNINRQVGNKLKAMSSDDLNHKRRTLHYKYINKANNRDLFLDTYDLSYYDPFESLKHSIKYKKRFPDPLRHDLDKEEREAAGTSKVVHEAPKSREILDHKDWQNVKFRGTRWGHHSVDCQDGSEVIVKNNNSFYSHDIMYHTKVGEGQSSLDDWFPRGKYIVPDQGKGWSFRERVEGKQRVYGLECMTQPKLQLYYV